MSLFDGARKFIGQIMPNRQIGQTEKEIDPMNIALQMGYSNAVYPEMQESDYLNWFRSWAYVAISAIAENTAQIELKLWSKSGKKVVAVSDHEVLDLLDNPNPLLNMSRNQLIELIQIYLELTGEAFVLVNKFRNTPMTMWVLRPDWMVVKTQGSSAIAYEYGFGKDAVIFQPDEILHFKHPNPTNVFRGKSVVQASDLTLETERLAETFNYNFFKQSALPRGILEYDPNVKITDETKKRIQTEWHKLYGGSDKSNRVALLTGGMKWQNVNMSQKDMDFIEGLKMNKEKILAMFRVHPHIVGLSENVNLANAQAADYSFTKFTIKPKMERIKDDLNQQLLIKIFKDSSLFFTYVDPVPQDKEAEARVAQIGIQSGFMTPNEGREMIGLELLKDDAADKLYMPSTLSPISEAANKVTRSYLPQAPRDRVSDTLLKRIIQDTVMEFAKKMVIVNKAKKSDHPEKIVKSEPALMDMIGQARIKRIVERLDKSETQLRDIIVEFFEDQADLVATRLLGGNIVKAKKVTPRSKFKLDDIFSVKEQADKLGESVILLISKLLDTEYKEALRFVGANENNMPETILTGYLENQVKDFALSVNETARRAIAQAVQDGLNNGSPMAEIAQFIRTYYEDTYTASKSLQIARTETMRATNFATDSAYKDAGVKSKQWLTAADERTCEFCAPLDGKVIDIGDNFFEKGDEYVSSEGNSLKLSYGDTGYPPLHPNCRCTIIPSFDKAMMIVNQKSLAEIREGLLEDLTTEAVSKIKEIAGAVQSDLTQIREDINNALKDATTEEEFGETG